MTGVAVFVILVLPLNAPQKSPAAPPSPPSPPEVQKTADALVGEWSGRMTAIVPGAEPESFPWSMSCRLAALGRGASSTTQGRASIGLLAQDCLLAYAPDDRVVHYMCVTSMGEIHDHKGHWTDDNTIDFEPLAGDFHGPARHRDPPLDIPRPPGLPEPVGDRDAGRKQDALRVHGRAPLDFT
jgi:hypothetical protein